MVLCNSVCINMAAYHLIADKSNLLLIILKRKRIKSNFAKNMRLGMQAGLKACKMNMLPVDIQKEVYIPETEDEKINFGSTDYGSYFYAFGL